MRFFDRQGRVLLLTAVLAVVGMLGCSPKDDDEGGSSGGDGIVGDWMAYSQSEGGETHYREDNYSKGIVSFRASGEVELIAFRKIGNVWVEERDVGDARTYRVSGSMIYFKYLGEKEDEGTQYRVSGNYFTVKSCYEDEKDDGSVYTRCYEATYKRVNIAEVRRSLGTVYTNDPKLSTSAEYRDLIWYSQDNENESIDFRSTLVDGNGLHRYADYDGGSLGYYTNGNKLVLVNEPCSWEDNDEYHCTVLGTFELTYKITGSGRNMQLSINGDI